MAKNPEVISPPAFSLTVLPGFPPSWKCIQKGTQMLCYIYNNSKFWISHLECEKTIVFGKPQGAETSRKASQLPGRTKQLLKFPV